MKKGEVHKHLSPAYLERVTGIEPASSAWKAEALPLDYARSMCADAVGGKRDGESLPSRSFVSVPRMRRAPGDPGEDTHILHRP